MLRNVSSLNTFAMLIIGNEILQAVVQDKNLPYAARKLATCGYDIIEARIIRDNQREIADAVSALSSYATYVICSGGVGPTHDDVSMAGIADGLGLDLVMHKEMLQFLTSRRKSSLSLGVEKMSLLPRGTELYMPGATWPLVRVQNVFILPGLPPAFQSKIDLLLSQLPEQPRRWTATVYVTAEETDFAETLQHIQEQEPAVEIGSYPVAGERYRAFISISSRSLELTNTVFTTIQNTLQDWILRSVPPAAQKENEP